MCGGGGGGELRYGCIDCALKYMCVNTIYEGEKVKCPLCRNLSTVIKML